MAKTFTGQVVGWPSVDIGLGSVENDIKLLVRFKAPSPTTLDLNGAKVTLEVTDTAEGLIKELAEWCYGDRLGVLRHYRDSHPELADLLSRVLAHYREENS